MALFLISIISGNIPLNVILAVTYKLIFSEIYIFNDLLLDVNKVSKFGNRNN